MLILGGERATGATSAGHANSPTRNNWRPLSNAGNPPARHSAGAVWTGTEALVFGGRAGGTVLAACSLRLARADLPPPQSFIFAVNRAVPDGDLSGLSDSQTLSAGPAPIFSVAVTLQLTPLGEGGFFGDLYAALVHSADGYAMLLNRSGRSADRPFGYSDGVPVHINLSDAAPADIHTYRLTLQGDEAVPLNAPLTGLWQPDGRAVDPLRVLDTHPRTATLARFSGSELEGLWVLFVADVSGGGEFRLDARGLEVTYIPEPGSGRLLELGLGAFAWHILRRRANAAPRRAGHRTTRLA